MKRFPIPLLLALALAACADSPKVKQAKGAVAEAFPYPSSAEFRSVREVAGGTVCGEVRGKDLRGELTGYRRFAWSAAGVTIEGEHAEPALARLNDSILGAACG